MCYNRGMNRAISLLVVTLLLAGCWGGSGRSPTAVTPPIVTPPPQPLPPPVCTFTFSWTNPTQDTNGRDLEVDELTAATLYQFRFPMAALEEVELIYDAGNPYTLMWEVRDLQQGTYYYTLTVSNAQGESGHSNEVTKLC